MPMSSSITPLTQGGIRRSDTLQLRHQRFLSLKNSIPISGHQIRRQPHEESLSEKANRIGNLQFLAQSTKVPAIRRNNSKTLGDRDSQSPLGLHPLHLYPRLMFAIIFCSDDKIPHKHQLLSTELNGQLDKPFAMLGAVETIGHVRAGHAPSISRLWLRALPGGAPGKPLRTSGIAGAPLQRPCYVSTGSVLAGVIAFRHPLGGRPKWDGRVATVSGLRARGAGGQSCNRNYPESKIGFREDRLIKCLIPAPLHRLEADIVALRPISSPCET
jgi:hypothetical protein